MPLLLLGFRDELTSRPWQPPARHWPGSALVGGRDEQAGGTWLAVHPGLPRVACILNARGQQAPPDARISRGDLPLRAAAEGTEALRTLHDDHGTLARYDPFFLICADVIPETQALMLSWDGQRSALEQLQAPGTHLITNAGHTYPPGSQDPDAKAEQFGPKFAAYRPDAGGLPGDDEAGRDPAVRGRAGGRGFRRLRGTRRERLGDAGVLRVLLSPGYGVPRSTAYQVVGSAGTGWKS